jgi:hypothetical protein
MKDEGKGRTTAWEFTSLFVRAPGEELAAGNVAP